MEILEKFNIELLKIMGVDADFPEPQRIQVFLNGVEICWIKNTKDIRSFSMRKANVIREAFRGCRSAWKFEFINGVSRFSIYAPMKAKRKWDRVEDKIWSIQLEENDFSRIPLEERKAKEEYGKRLLRRIKKVIVDPVEQEDAFRLNMRRASTSPYNFGSLEGLKKMKQIYELGGYSALGRNEYWWADMIYFHEAHPNMTYANLLKVVRFHKNNPEWSISFAFDAPAFNFIQDFFEKYEKENGRSPHLDRFSSELCKRSRELINHDEVVIPLWAQYQVLNSKETPAYWKFPRAPKNEKIAYLGVQKGGIDAVREYTGIDDIPKRIAGKIYAAEVSGTDDVDNIIRQETGITFDVCR